jgi:hypothetical protein
MSSKDRYINPFTDFGFKKLFGTEFNKELLIDFLNQVLGEREQIRDLTYRIHPVKYPMILTGEALYWPVSRKGAVIL